RSDVDHPFAFQIEGPDELGEALAADEIARVKHRRANGQAKTCDPRRAGRSSRQHQVVGKEMNQPTEASTERAVRETAAAEAAGKAVFPQFNRIVHALIHDRPMLLPTRTMQPSRRVIRGGGKKARTVGGTPKVVNAFNDRRNRGRFKASTSRP